MITAFKKPVNKIKGCFLFTIDFYQRPELEVIMCGGAVQGTHR